MKSVWASWGVCSMLALVFGGAALYGVEYSYQKAFFTRQRVYAQNQRHQSVALLAPSFLRRHLERRHPRDLREMRHTLRMALYDVDAVLLDPAGVVILSAWSDAGAIEAIDDVAAARWPPIRVEDDKGELLASLVEIDRTVWKSGDVPAFFMTRLGELLSGETKNTGHQYALFLSLGVFAAVVGLTLGAMRLARGVLRKGRRVRMLEREIEASRHDARRIRAHEAELEKQLAGADPEGEERERLQGKLVSLRREKELTDERLEATLFTLDRVKEDRENELNSLIESTRGREREDQNSAEAPVVPEPRRRADRNALWYERLIDELAGDAVDWHSQVVFKKAAKTISKLRHIDRTKFYRLLCAIASAGNPLEVSSAFQVTRVHTQCDAHILHVPGPQPFKAYFAWVQRHPVLLEVQRTDEKHLKLKFVQKLNKRLKEVENRTT